MKGAGGHVSTSQGAPWIGGAPRLEGRGLGRPPSEPPGGASLGSLTWY